LPEVVAQRSVLTAGETGDLFTFQKEISKHRCPYVLGAANRGNEEIRKFVQNFTDECTERASNCTEQHVSPQQSATGHGPQQGLNSLSL